MVLEDLLVLETLSPNWSLLYRRQECKG